MQPFDDCLLALDPAQREVAVPGCRSKVNTGQGHFYAPPEDDTSLTSFLPSVAAMTVTSDATTEFFDRYAAALLARDEASIAALYAVPSLILFPGQSIAVSDVKETEQFFAASWAQYEGVDAINKTITVMQEGPGTIWADVTWSYAGAREHFCYQLVERPTGLQIAVLTLLA